MRSSRRAILTVIAAVSATVACQDASKPTDQKIANEAFDILIKGGAIVDGGGAPAVSADVGIRNGRIVFVGQAAGDSAAGEVIDAHGLVVAPGFIDVHNHSLDDVVNERWTQPLLNAQYLTQGVTTIVTGADGMWSPDQVRTIKQKLSDLGAGFNYACYIGHNGIRTAVMKNDQQRAPTDQELAEMQSETRAGMEEGCVGLSTGLMYDPGRFSKTAEVIALAKIVAEYGGSYDSHVRDPVGDRHSSDAEAIEIGRAANIPVKIAHIKAVGVSNRGGSADIIMQVEDSRAQGRDVVTDQYPYDGAATGSLYELIQFPGVFDLYSQPRPQIIAGILEVIQDEARHDEVKQASEHGVDGQFSWLNAVGYGNIKILSAPSHPELEGENILELAAKRRMDPYDLLVQIILQTQESPPLATFGLMDETDVQALIVKPWNMIASDGFYVGLDPETFDGAPRSTGTFPRVLGHYSRSLGLFSLEEAVRKMTSLPAEHLGMEGRGRISVGNVADIVVFDADAIADNSTWVNPGAYSSGVHDVLVNGKFALRNGVVTGETHGVFVAHRSPK